MDWKPALTPFLLFNFPNLQSLPPVIAHYFYISVFFHIWFSLGHGKSPLSPQETVHPFKPISNLFSLEKYFPCYFPLNNLSPLWVQLFFVSSAHLGICFSLLLLELDVLYLTVCPKTEVPCPLLSSICHSWFKAYMVKFCYLIVGSKFQWIVLLFQLCLNMYSST